jgi:hypothetical protein
MRFRAEQNWTEVLVEDLFESHADFVAFPKPACIGWQDRIKKQSRFAGILKYKGSP